jgi:hemolysin activation/secretion protein
MIGFVLTAALGCDAYAQEALPNVGTTVREIEQKRPQVPALTDPALQIGGRERLAMRAGPGTTFVVSSVRLSGITAFSDLELLPLVSGLAGREVNLADLEAAAARVTQFYRDHGFAVARAYVPAQKIQGGSVEIAVLEGRYGSVDLHNTSSLSDGLIQKTLRAPATDGLIETAPLEHDLLLLNDLAGIAATATLAPGATVGTSNLLVAIAPSHTYSATLEADNFGNRYTGEARFGGSIAAANLAGRGDLLSVRGLVSQDTGIWYGRAGYQIPAFANGLRLGAAYSHTYYSLGEEFNSLDADGNADIYTLFSQYPLIRSARGSLDVQLSFNYFDLDDVIDATDVKNPRELQSYVFGLSGHLRDDLLGGGISAGSLAIGTGKLQLNDAVAGQIDEVTAQTEGDFNTLLYSALRMQRLTDTLQLYVAVQGQFADQNLDASQKFVLGGPNAVRAYAQGEGVGDAGILGTAELRYTLPARGWFTRTQVFAFFDGGRVRINEEQFLPGENDIDLFGAGVGLNVEIIDGFTLRGSMAWAVGSPSERDVDHSGSQGWIQLVKSF